jgi:hypothetical protein
MLKINFLKHYLIPTELDIDIFFRFLSITAVIFLHSQATLIHEFGSISQKYYNINVGGGAALLLLISGFNLARFQSNKLFTGSAWQIVTRFFYKIIMPYYCILIIYLLYKQKLDYHSLFLISNYHGRFGSFLEPFWFLEVLFQNLLIICGLFLIPSFRKLAEKFPFEIGLGALFIALAFRLIEVTDEEVLGFRTPDKVFCLYIFGWCLWFAKSRYQKWLINALCLTLFPFLYGTDSTYTIWLVLGSLGIMWKPKILLPRFIHTAISVTGISTFYIYLTHIIPVHVSVYIWHSQNISAILLIAILLGIYTDKLIKKCGSLTFSMKPSKTQG